jgi:hypothetical protein
MKESAAYKLTQMAVLYYPRLNYEQKLEILRVLMSREDLAVYSEKQQENEAEA